MGSGCLSIYFHTSAITNLTYHWHETCWKAERIQMYLSCLGLNWEQILWAFVCWREQESFWTRECKQTFEWVTEHLRRNLYFEEYVILWYQKIKKNTKKWLLIVIFFHYEFNFSTNHKRRPKRTNSAHCLPPAPTVFARGPIGRAEKTSGNRECKQRFPDVRTSASL